VSESPAVAVDRCSLISKIQSSIVRYRRRF